MDTESNKSPAPRASHPDGGRSAPGRSILQASVGARCLVAAAISALLWLAVAWAMGAA